MHFRFMYYDNFWQSICVSGMKSHWDEWRFKIWINLCLYFARKLFVSNITVQCFQIWNTRNAVSNKINFYSLKVINCTRLVEFIYNISLVIILNKTLFSIIFFIMKSGKLHFYFIRKRTLKNHRNVITEIYSLFFRLRNKRMDDFVKERFRKWNSTTINNM